MRVLEKPFPSVYNCRESQGDHTPATAGRPTFIQTERVQTGGPQREKERRNQPGKGIPPDRQRLRPTHRSCTGRPARRSVLPPRLPRRQISTRRRVNTNTTALF